MEEKSEDLIKICLIGSVHTKLQTAFMRGFAEDKFDGNYLPTLGVDITTKKISVKDRQTKLILVDTAGQEFFGKLRPNYYRGASGVIILFDKGDYKSFTDVPNWLKEFRDNLYPNIEQWNKYHTNWDRIKTPFPNPDLIPVFLIGLITKPEEVSVEEAKALANQMEATYFECLPTEGKKIIKVFEHLIMKSTDEESENQK